MRTNLVVPFAEKDRAKKLGARWDPAQKVWYVEDVKDIGAFAEWMPAHPVKPAIRTAIPSPPGRSILAKQPEERAVNNSAGVITGAKTIPLSCDCLPWLGCEKCQPVLEAMGWGAKA